VNLSAAAGFAQGRVSLDRPSWASNNAMAFLISAGAGCNSSACQRTAESVDGEGPAAPILRVSYATAAAGGAPPNLVVPGDGYTLAPNQSIVVTFEVTVNSPLAPAFTEITNTATLNTNQQGPFVASAIDDVVRLGVTVEPNNAGFTVAGGAVTTPTSSPTRGRLPTPTPSPWSASSATRSAARGPFEAVADRRRGEAPSKLLASGYVKEARTSRLAPPADPAATLKAAACAARCTTPSTSSWRCTSSLLATA
jgi:hypothetical protein